MLGSQDADFRSVEGVYYCLFIPDLERGVIDLVGYIAESLEERDARGRGQDGRWEQEGRLGGYGVREWACEGIRGGVETREDERSTEAG